MTQLNWNTNWTYDPFDIVWKNFLNNSSNFSSIFDSKINHPVDVYETENGLRFEFAVVGLNKEDIDIQVDGDTLRVKHERLDQEIPLDKYLHKGIARRSFDLAWKIASKLDLGKLEAKLDKGLLTLDIPYSVEKAPKKIDIK